jgi:hypothetical protein
MKRHRKRETRKESKQTRSDPAGPQQTEYFQSKKSCASAQRSKRRDEHKKASREEKNDKRKENKRGPDQSVKNAFFRSGEIKQEIFMDRSWFFVEKIEEDIALTQQEDHGVNKHS